MQLTNRQAEAATHPARRLCIRAGPGTGKTTVLTYRIVHLVRDLGVDPSRVCALTFTRNAASEMRVRAETMLPQAKGRLTLRTFHSLALLVLRAAGARGLEVMSESQRLRLIRPLAEKRDLDPRRTLTAISRAKNQMITPDELEGRDPETASVWREYEALKKALDYDDLLIAAVDVLRSDGHAVKERFTHVLVDEFQDLSPIQYELLRLLGAKAEHVCAVGDPLQCIYEWRASSPEVMDRFCEDFDAVLFDLNENFRSKKAIVDTANRVMGFIDPGRPALVPTLHGEGEVKIRTAKDEAEEAQLIAEELAEESNPSECAVLIRKNAQAEVLEEALSRRGLEVSREYSLRSRVEVRVLTDLVKLILDPEEHSRILLKRASIFDRYLGAQFREELRVIARTSGISAFQALDGTFSRRYLAVGARRIKETIQQLHQLSRQLPPAQFLSELRRRVELDRVLEERMIDEHGDAITSPEVLDRLIASAEGFSDVEEFLSWLEAPSTRGVNIMTVHRAKGLEFRKVFVPGLIEGTFPASDLPEEWRLFFVAVTRAKDSLVLSIPGPPEKSPFMKALLSSGSGTREGREVKKGLTVGDLLERIARILKLRR